MFSFVYKNKIKLSNVSIKKKNDNRYPILIFKIKFQLVN